MLQPQTLVFCLQARTWSVADLRRHLGNATGSPGAFNGLWAAIQRSVGAPHAAGTLAV